jgi:hypothetical protein
MKSAIELQEMKDFLLVLAEYFRKEKGLTQRNPDQLHVRPEFIKTLSKSAIAAGLTQAVNDMVEMSAPMTAKKIAEIDSHLKSKGCKTLTHFRLKKKKYIKIIIQKQRIDNAEEYYALKRYGESEYRTLNRETQESICRIMESYKKHIATP